MYGLGFSGFLVSRVSTSARFLSIAPPFKVAMLFLVDALANSDPSSIVFWRF